MVVENTCMSAYRSDALVQGFACTKQRDDCLASCPGAERVDTSQAGCCITCRAGEKVCGNDCIPATDKCDVTFKGCACGP
ncbi:MAG: hypothetical protein HYZ28_16615 [Myxococcales bacterium]|nr:hypothetical protein [Myxococcales bacterium]